MSEPQCQQHTRNKKKGNDEWQEEQHPCSRGVPLSAEEVDEPTPEERPHDGKQDALLFLGAGSFGVVDCIDDADNCQCYIGP